MNHIDANEWRRDSSVASSQPPPQAGRDGYKTDLPTLLIFIAGLLVALVAFLSGRSIVVQIVCGSVSLTLVGLAAALQMADRERFLDSLFSGQLGPWFGASFAVVFGLASLGWASPPTGGATLISRESVLRAMVVVAVAIGCFTIGYGVARHRLGRGRVTWLQRLIFTESPVRDGQRTAWLLFGIAIVADLGQIAIGRFGYLSNPATAVTSGNPFSQVLFIFGTFSIFAVALSANDYVRHHGAQRLASFAIILVAHSFIGLFSGEKEVVALGFLAAILGYAASSRRPPIAGALAATLMFTFVVVPLTTTYRSQVAVGNTRLSPVQAFQMASHRSADFLISARRAVVRSLSPTPAQVTPAPASPAPSSAISPSPLVGSPAPSPPAPPTLAPTPSAATTPTIATPTPPNAAQSTQASATQTGQRISRIGDVAIIVQRTTPSDIAYRPVTELLEAPLLGLVPRAVWPGKPVLATGYQFSRQYYRLAPSQYTSSAITPEGDLWRHGGWLVLIAGMLLFGAGVRILDATIGDLRTAPVHVLLVLSFFPLIVKHETDAVSLLASVPSVLFGVVIAARLVTLRFRRPAVSVDPA
jgi:hypothetical protein